ncbi:MAG: cystathionine gamma-synthase [Flavobacteriales bacterium]
MKIETKLLHAGIKPDESTGAIMTPIYQTSTYVQQEVGVHKGFAYSRTHNPTRAALEDNLAAIENASYGLCFSSGMAAIDAVLRLLNPGDQVIASYDLYGGTYRIFTTIFAKYGIEFFFVDMNNVNDVANAITSNTRLIWIETPTNPMMSIVDIEAIAGVKEESVLLAVDNTFASPYLQNPINYGADICMHSATKYLGGHSDVVMGALMLNNKAVAEELYKIQNSCGAVSAPQDCFLVLRGIKTLHVRMDRHCRNANEIAKFLEEHPLVEQVHYPGLVTHPNHEIAKKQMKGFGGMISFSLKEDTIEKAHELLKKTKIFALAESLGGVESLIGHPATMTHSAIPRAERLKSGIVDSMIRISVGIEDVTDLIQDLKQALT